MSRWFARLAELRQGTTPQFAGSGSPLHSSNCSIVQNGPLKATFEHLNKLNSAAPWVKFDAVDLLAHYHDRAGTYEDNGQSRADAEARAWNQVASQWHCQRSRPADDDLCAGCGQHLEGAPEVAIFPSGERVHANNGFDCIRRYVSHWRAEAAAALEAINIPTPSAIAADETGWPTTVLDECGRRYSIVTD